LSTASRANSFPFSVQVNSYNNALDAEKRVQRLKQMEYDCFTYSMYVPKKDKTYYRVFIGKYQDLQSAEKACEELKKKGDFTEDIYVVNRDWAIGG
jgi:cell division septation protein DedD